MIENLDQFLKERGHETPYSFGRALYKYTDCGPWVQFMVEVEPAKKEVLTAKIINVGNRPWLNNAKELNADFIHFLGFKTRAYRDRKESYLGYIKLIENYMTQKCVGSNHNRKLQFIKHENPEYLILQSEYEKPAKVENVYYESPEVNTFDHQKCIGIRIGSIVEGSDVEIGPHELLFPFEMNEIDRIIEDINSEASFYWDRDNSHWYCVVSHRNVGLKETWGEFTWEDSEGDIPQADREKIEQFISDDEEYRGYDETFTVGEYVLCEYLNDTIF